MSFDAGDIRAEATLDKSPFIRSLRELHAEGRRFAAEKFTANVGADTGEGDAKVLAFQRKLAGVGTSTTSAKVTADTTEGLLKIQPLTVKLDEIRNRVTTARVDASTDEAKRKLDALDLQLRRVGLITSRPRVSLAGAESANIQLDAIAAKLAALNVASAAPGVPGSSGGGGGGSLLSRIGSHAPGFGTLAVGAAIPALAPLAGLGLAGGASLLTPFTAAGVGIGSFAIAAHSSIKTLQTDMKTLATLQTRYNAAVTDKDRAAALKAEKEAWRAISPQQRAAITNIQRLKTDYADFQKQLAPEIFPAIAGGVKLLGTGLNLLEPVTASTGKAIVGLEHDAEHAFQAPFWKDFFHNFLPGEATRATDSFGKALGNLLDAGAHLVEGFAPLGHDFEGGLVGLTKRFDDWSQGSGPARFVKWVRREAPIIKHDVGEIASGVKNVGEALIPLGTDVLNTVGKVAGAIGDFSKAHPGDIKRIGEALLVVGAGLKAIKVAGSIADTVGVITSMRGGGKSPIGGIGGCCCGPGGGGVPTNTPGKTVEKTAEKEGEQAAEKGGILTWLGSKLSPKALGISGLATTLGLTYFGTQGGSQDSSATQHYRAATAAQQPVDQRTISALVTAIINAAAVRDDKGQSIPFQKTSNGFETGPTGIKYGEHGTASVSNIAQAAQFVLSYGNPQQIAALKELAKTYPQVRTAVERYAASQRNLGSLLNGTFRQTQNAQGAADAYAQRLLAQGVPLDRISGKVQNYLNHLHKIPPGVNTKVVADTASADAAVTELGHKLGAITGHVWNAVVDIFSNNSGGSSGGGKHHATGGPIIGPGGPTSDRVPILASNGEHMWTAREVQAVGGHAAVEGIRHAALQGSLRYGNGGPVHLPAWYKSGNHAARNSGGGSGSASGSSSSSGHGSSSGSSGSSKSHGPSKLAVSNALASIANFAGLTFVSDLEGTAHQVRSGIGQMIDRLNSAVRNHYLDGDKKLVKALKAARAPLAQLADEEDQVNKSLASAQQRLSNLRGNAASVRSGTLSSFLGLGDLTQASQTTSVGGLLDVEGQQVKVARAFKRNLQHLRHLGLSRDEYRALDQAGPAAAGQVVGLLATSTRGQVRRFNRNEGILRKLGATTGSASADYLYKSRIHDAKGDVQQFRQDRREIIRHEKRTADAVEKLVTNGLQDHTTHAKLEDLKTLIRNTNRLLNGLADANNGQSAGTRSRWSS